MKTLNIKETLRKKLFEIPKPINEIRHHFHVLNDMIFPGKMEMLAFLNETNYQKSEDIAKRILLRLCYESSFPPPTKLLFNLLEFESNIGHNKKSDFVAKDHFVHLVNLYLLGVYVFFYHESLSKAILDYLKKELRNDANISKENLAKDSVFNFIKIWQYFVLNHDLGYPLEFLYGEGYSDRFSKKPSEDVYLKPFNNIKEYYIKDIALKSLTKLVLFGQIIEFSSDDFSDRVISFLNNQKLRLLINYKKSEENDFKEIEFEVINDLKILNGYSELVFLEKVHGNNSLHIVVSLLGKEKITAVLRRKNEEEPLILLIPNPNSDLLHDVFLTDYYKNSTKKIRGNKLIEAAFAGNAFYANYEWTYYIDKVEENFEKALEKNFPILTKENYSQLKKFFTKEASHNFSLISNNTIFSEYSYQLYYSLFHTLELTADDPDNLTSLERDQKIIIPILKNVHKKLPEQLSKLFTNKLDELLTKKTNPINGAQDINNLILGVLNSIGSTNKKIADILAEQISNEVVTEINLKKIISETWRVCRKKINSSIQIDSKIQLSNNISEGLLFNGLKETMVFKNLKSNLHQNDWNAFIKYIPEFAKTNKWQKYNDHGIMSSIIAINNLNIYKEVNSSIEGLEIEETEEIINSMKLLKLGLTETNHISKSHIDHLINKIIKEAQYSILVHNIYPKNFKGFHKTTIKNSPFPYFAILCDSLQPWDRKRLMNPGIQKLPYSTYGNKFNIQINNQIFEIHEEGEFINIKERIDVLRSYLDDYLENASQIIKLSFSEY